MQYIKVQYGFYDPEITDKHKISINTTLQVPIASFHSIDIQHKIQTDINIIDTVDTQDTKPYQYDTKPCQPQQNTDLTTPLLEVQNRMTKTLHRAQQQSSIDDYMAGLKTCRGDSSKEFNSWFLSIRNISKLTILKAFALPKLKESPKHLLSIPLHKFSCSSLKEKM